MDLDEEHEQATSYDIDFVGDLTLEFNRTVVICDFPILKTTVQKNCMNFKIMSRVFSICCFI